MQPVLNKVAISINEIPVVLHIDTAKGLGNILCETIYLSPFIGSRCIVHPGTNAAYGDMSRRRYALIFMNDICFQWFFQGEILLSSHWCQRGQWHQQTDFVETFFIMFNMSPNFAPPRDVTVNDGVTNQKGWFVKWRGGWMLTFKRTQWLDLSHQQWVVLGELLHCRRELRICRHQGICLE